MKDHRFNEFLEWISGGSLTACMAFVVFVPTVESMDSAAKSVSLGMIVSAIPLLVCALALRKRFSHECEEQVKSAAGHITPAVAGNLLMFFGFGLMVFSLMHLMGYVFLVSSALALHLYLREVKIGDRS